MGTGDRRGIAVLVALTTAVAPVGCSSSGSRKPKGGSTTAKSTTKKGTTTEKAPDGECDDLVVTTEGAAPGGLRLVLTNAGTGPCTIGGFPGVRLDGADGATREARREGGPPEVVELRAGGRAVAALTFAPGGWEVRSLVVAPPGDDASPALPWPGGPVAEAGGVTVGPLTAG
ncbi:DUF4232 domain-containing protein [Saccharothrix syringae]|uniref:DUF4232 domain-containing protein n=1 Tax=Saccharothrix syringae TaxID=103733 RepID=A0A5Q0HDE9_SACSY|nr:DUF4232 domain-containing protein [Saccharothrix syringae]QFZ23870.1 DUF4232 domain-containing protein [Saccharothrix syringae]